MNDSILLDRRSLLQLFALSGGALAGFSAASVSAAPFGVDPRLQRAYCSSVFGQLHYWTIGHGDALVLLHQSAQSSAEFAAIAPLLSEHFRVIAIDLPGHGQSDTPSHELTMNEYSLAVLAVMDAVGVERAHVVGQHGGATVAINLSINHAARVAKVILSGAGRGEDIDIDEIMNTPMTRDLPVDADGDFLEKTWAVYRKMSAKSTPPEITFQPFLVSLQQRVRVYDMHYAALRWDYLPLLVNYKKQTLLIHAEEDIYAGDVAGLQARMPGSVIKRVANCGSWQFYEQPAANATVMLEFLQA